MRTFQLLGLIVLLGLGLFATQAQAGPPARWSVGINVGAPAYRPYYHYHHHHHPYFYARPFPLLYPAPVIYESAPVIVRPATVVVQPVTSYAPPADSFQAPAPTPVQPGADKGVLDFHLQRLTHPDENVRRDSVMELGRSKSGHAVDSLNATLAGDKSPAVRDAAARALGLIGSPSSLTVLIHAAQADADRDVRHSAQFAVEIIRSNLKK